MIHDEAKKENVNKSEAQRKYMCSLYYFYSRSFSVNLKKKYSLRALYTLSF